MRMIAFYANPIPSFQQTLSIPAIAVVFFQPDVSPLQNQTSAQCPHPAYQPPTSHKRPGKSAAFSYPHLCRTDLIRHMPPVMTPPAQPIQRIRRIIPHRPRPPVVRMSSHFLNIAFIVVHVVQRSRSPAFLTPSLFAVVNYLALRIPFHFAADNLSTFPVHHGSPLALPRLRYRLIRPDEATHRRIGTRGKSPIPRAASS